MSVQRSFDVLAGTTQRYRAKPLKATTTGGLDVFDVLLRQCTCQVLIREAAAQHVPHHLDVVVPAGLHVPVKVHDSCPLCIAGNSMPQEAELSTVWRSEIWSSKLVIQFANMMSLFIRVCLI